MISDRTIKANEALTKIIKLGEQHNVHMTKVQQKLISQLGKQVSSLDTGSMIELARMQLKTYSYILKKGMKEDDNYIEIPAIPVLKSAKENTPKKLRFKERREKERIEGQTGYGESDFEAKLSSLLSTS